MSKTYRLSPIRKLVNTLLSALLQLGVPMGSTYLLIIRGRKSGRQLTMPVALIEKGK
jgi:hypothetical protein